MLYNCCIISTLKGCIVINSLVCSDIRHATKLTVYILTQVRLLVARCRPRLQKLPSLRFMHDGLLLVLDSELCRNCSFCCSNRTSSHTEAV